MLFRNKIDVNIVGCKIMLLVELRRVDVYKKVYLVHRYILKFKIYFFLKMFHEKIVLLIYHK